MKRQWLAILFLLTLVCCLFCCAGAETVNVDPSIVAPSNIQVTATKVGQPFTVTWDGEEFQEYEIHLYDSDGRIVRWFYPNYDTGMYYDIFRQMPGTYTVGIQANGWIDYEKHSSEEMISQPFTVAASGKTWDYAIADGKAKIKAYYGNDTDVTVPETLGGYTVTEIGDFAFNCRDIHSISLPSSITQINSYAFADSTLHTITVGGQVRMEPTAFSGCTGLKVTGLTGSDAELAANNAEGVAFESAGSVSVAPTAIRNEKADDEYNCYIRVSDPNADRYEYRRFIKYSNGDEWENSEFLEVLYTGQEAEASIYYAEPSMTEIDVEFRALKNGKWSAWTEPVVITPTHSSELDLENATELTGASTLLDVQGATFSLIRITPAETDTYTFYTSGDYDTYGVLFDSDGYPVIENDDGGNSYNFMITNKLTAGETYYLGVRFYSNSLSDKITVYTECSLFSTIQAPTAEINMNADRDMVVTLSAEIADSFRLYVKYVSFKNESYSQIINLDSVNGTASYVLEDPQIFDAYYEITAIAVKGEDISCRMTPITLKGKFEGVWNGFAWKENDDGEITIVEYNGHESKVVVPQTINGLPVTTIGERAFCDNYDITSVILPEGIKTIQYAAFAECGRLYSVHLPETLKVIDSRAFQYCYQMVCINLPGSVESIGYEAFSECNSLMWLSISSDFAGELDYYVFDGCSNLTVEDTGRGTGWEIANSNGCAFCQADESSMPLQVPEVRFTGTAYFGTEITIDLFMQEAEGFRVIDRPYWYEVDFQYGYYDLYDDSVEAEDGVGTYHIYCDANYLTHRLIVSALVKGEWTPWTDVLEIKPGYAGQLSTPEPVIEGTITAGNEYTITWPAVEHASRYYVYISEPNNPDFKINIYGGSETKVNQVWSNCAGDYLVYVEARSDTGWRSSEMAQIPVTAEPGESDFIYETYEDGLHITGFIGMKTIQEIIVPSEINDVPVVEIQGEVFSNLPEVRFIKIPDTVKRIGWAPFYCCPNLESIVYDGPVIIDGVIAWQCNSIKCVTFNHPNADLTTDALGGIPNWEELLIRGYTGSAAEIAARKLGCKFESIGSMPACPEFNVTGETEHEDGLVHPNENFVLTMTDPETTQIEYRLNYLELGITETETYRNGCIAAVNGVIQDTIHMDNAMMNPRLTVRAYKNGIWTLWSEPVELAYVSERLPKVTGVQAKCENGLMTISWDPVENAREYSIYFCKPGYNWGYWSVLVSGVESYTTIWDYETGEYDICVVANGAVSRDKLPGPVSDRARVTLTNYSGEPIFIADATTGIIDISPVHVTVYAKDATNVEIRYDVGNGDEWVYTSYSTYYINATLRNEGTYTYKAYASWDDGETWTEIGQETITITSLGTLQTPQIHTKAYLREGEDLVFSVDEVEHAELYYCYIYDWDCERYVADYLSITPGQTVTIESSKLAGRHYSITVNVFADGYRSGSRNMCIDIVPETVHEISLVADKDTVVPGDTIRLTVNAPGATCILVYRNGSANTCLWPDGSGWGSVNCQYDRGEVTQWYARAYYGDTTDFDPYDASLYDGPSEPITVRCISQGTAPVPEVSIKTPTDETPYLTATISPTGIVDEYELTWFENGNSFEYQYVDVDPENPMNNITLTIPETMLRGGSTYTVYVQSKRYGYDTTGQFVDNFSYTHPGTEEERYFHVSSNTGTVDISPVSYLAYADGADYIKVSRLEEDGELFDQYSSFGGIIRDTVNYECNNQVFIAYASWDDGETWEEIGQQTITVSYLGALEEAQIHTKPYLLPGEDMVITVDTVEHEGWYNFRVYQCDPWTYVYSEDNIRPGGTITIPASELTGKRYRMYGWAYGNGYRSAYIPDMYVDILRNGLKLPIGTTEIGDEAFRGTDAEYVIIPNGTASIGSMAFADCYDLKMIEIPASVTSIDDDAFAGCYDLVIRTTEGSTAFDKFSDRDGISIEIMK